MVKSAGVPAKTAFYTCEEEWSAYNACLQRWETQLFDDLGRTIDEKQGLKPIFWGSSLDITHEPTWPKKLKKPQKTESQLEAV